MNTTYRYLIAAATLVSTASLVDAQARGRMGPPPSRTNAVTALTTEQRTQLRELREQQLVEQRALQQKHREALAKIAPEQARRMSQLRDQRDRQDRHHGVQMMPPRGRGLQMAPPRRGGSDVRQQDDRRQRGPVRRPPPPRDRR